MWCKMAAILPHLTIAPLQANVLTQIKTILAEALKDEGGTIYLFGSRATGVFTATSDFDVAVLAAKDIGRKLSLVREKLDHSNIPFKVDVVELRLTSAAFNRQVRAEGLVLWKN